MGTRTRTPMASGTVIDLLDSHGPDQSSAARSVAARIDADKVMPITSAIVIAKFDAGSDATIYDGDVVGWSIDKVTSSASGNTYVRLRREGRL